VTKKNKWQFRKRINKGSYIYSFFPSRIYTNQLIDRFVARLFHYNS
jgi:hypothetical protein